MRNAIVVVICFVMATCGACRPKNADNDNAYDRMMMANDPEKALEIAKREKYPEEKLKQAAQALIEISIRNGDKKKASVTAAEYSIDLDAVVREVARVEKNEKVRAVVAQAFGDLPEQAQILPDSKKEYQNLMDQKKYLDAALVAASQDLSGNAFEDAAAMLLSTEKVSEICRLAETATGREVGFRLAERCCTLAEKFVLNQEAVRGCVVLIEKNMVGIEYRAGVKVLAGVLAIHLLRRKNGSGYELAVNVLRTHDVPFLPIEEALIASLAVEVHPALLYVAAQELK